MPAKWFGKMDAVAAAATEGCREGRKLYTDSERITLRARAWICLTTPNPTFASDAFNIGMGIIVMPLVIPWGYLFRHYMKRSGARWR